MRLTRLEIKGFKSFGDKVVINFDEGITGIVGPNGCGKSNVVDAIRWVLGEQKTKALRSDKMENVIFNGTKHRKPSQLAEVSLTFDNTKNLLPTEYSRVTITRRYYRSGESEYELNGVACRLKDISNLFLDTGIASNSYAIIELKMVDELLNDKEGSRRALFEEAAGISKFKKRKKETLRKLEETNADLERVKDLLFEIEKNLKSLERQAKQAERYFALKEDYKKLSLRLGRLAISQSTERFLGLHKQLEAEQDRKGALDAQLAEREALAEESKAQLLGREKLLSSRQKTLNEHVSKIRQVESDKKIKNERLRFLNDKRDSLLEQLQSDKQSYERAAFSLNGLAQERSEAEALATEAKALLDELREAHDEQKSITTALREEAATATNQQRQLQEQAFKLSKSLEIKQMQLSSLRQELEKTAQEGSQHSNSLSQFEDKLADVQEAVAEKEQELQQLQADEGQMQQQLAELEQGLNQNREALAADRRQLDARQNEYNLTKSLVDNLEGFPEAIRYLKKKTDWGRNVPLLSDIITCSEAYRVAIETYLEPWMNHYVVDSWQQAQEAIALLSEAARGRAQFFVLEALPPASPSPTTPPAGCTPALSVVEADPKYAPLTAHLFADTYLCEDAEMETIGSSAYSLISRSGRIIKRRYSLLGGSVGMFEGKRIGRAKNLEKLQKDIQQLLSEVSRLEKLQQEQHTELGRLKSSTRRPQIEAVSRELSLLQQELVQVRTRHEQLLQLLSNQATRQDDMRQQMEVLQDEIADIDPEAAAVAERLQALEARSIQLQDDLAYQNEALSVKSARFNEQNLLYHQKENKLNSLVQEMGFKQQSLQSSEERISRNKSSLADTEAEIEGLMQRGELGDEELMAMYSEKESIEAGVNEAERDYYEMRGQIDALEKEARELQRRRESSQALMMELQNRQNEYKLQLTSVKERLAVEFNVDAEELMEAPAVDELLSEAELQQEVRQVREKIDKIGPINPMAMEAYQEIQERYQFITAQRDDLVKAQESLLETMAQLDSAAQEAFLSAFEQIKENFVKVFRSLFTEEDDCDLRLTDPSNPLETTIDIIAKPKGKRPLTINQLSGGEKTLTATSLLFSIYLLKPAPFCIFDEVDAPLDDANIDKFNNIIRKFSQDSQFIIVTHNKRTMASTDIMYGVTMLEMGVSRVVPVDLRELEVEF
ncbi:chromosome segregation protein SMC [Cesiribacter andamanensis]|uniref:Chromosome partition protein Smc n=1 Tax=Cesiribacter andamanensis AMV16 TaxID=1279009 RepID=M7MXW7_9BACT|nr:chromosome segregation protein SMC [Cesiribacter andamanensis]EMR01268.1 Chromosome partition protein Smc [Cesiribacter andamanensis AMV16]